MKKLIYIIALAALVTACGKEDECYECKNAKNQVQQTYCNVSQSEANSKSALWTLDQLRRINESVMSNETRQAEIARVTITHCDKQ